MRSATVIVVIVGLFQSPAATLDLSSKPTDSVQDASAEPPQPPTLCCVGACTQPGMEKYWSIAEGIDIFGLKAHCGETCMDPKKYSTFKVFENNLTKANNTVTPCQDFGYTFYDSTPTHGFGPLKITLDLFIKPEPPKPSTLCCEGACKQPGMEKYWSIAEGKNGNEHCGETCSDPKKYSVFKFFEKNLTRANNTVTPCQDFGYTLYDSTPTHGFGPLKITLDLFNKPTDSVQEASSEPPQPTLCCVGACTQPGMEKYWSIAEGIDIFGLKAHCGETCMDPKKYSTFKVFENNLTRANNTVTPCQDFGYTFYDSTPTHGFGPLKITLDLFIKPEPPKPSTLCCEGACKQPGMEKYWSIAEGKNGNEHCGETCSDPKKYSVFKFFEKNLTRANNTVTPCQDFGYTLYNSTPTHGFGPLKITLDLFNKPTDGLILIV